MPWLISNWECSSPAQDLHEGLRKKWAYDFSGDERLGVFLTNTLEEAERRAQMEFGLSAHA